MTQLGHGLSMLVEYEHARLVDKRPSGAHDAIEDVVIPSSRKGRAGIQCFVETGKVEQSASIEGHVAADAEDTGPAGVQIPAPRILIGISLPREAVPETAPALEENLCPRGEFQREYLPGDSKRVGVNGQRILQTGKPPSIDDHVVIEVGDILACCLLQRAVAREVEPGSHFTNICDIAVPFRGLPCGISGWCIVDNQYIKSTHTLVVR
jgi:hypothetical protein